MKHNKILAVIFCVIMAFTLSSCAQDNEGGTNIQEASVDEGDIVKIGADGLIYNSQSDGITVTQTDKGQLNVIAAYRGQNYVPKEMFINGNYLITIGGIAKSIDFGSNKKYYDYYNFNYNYTETVLNIFDIGAVKAMAFGGDTVSLEEYLVYSFSIGGEYFTSRLYFESQELYVIFNYNDYIKIVEKNDGKKTTYEYQKTAVEYTENNTEKTFDTAQVVDDTEGKDSYRDAAIIIKLTLGDNIVSTMQGFYGAQFVDLYMSENALYPIFQLYQSDGKKGSCYNMMICVSYVLKVSRDDLQTPHKIILRDYSVYGRYAVKDFGDSFFIAATSPGGSAVFAYDKDFNQTGIIDGIAPGEDIKSANYQEVDGRKYCYITTFRRTDPLFKIDITSPQNMEVLSALAMPGYATYLFNLSGKYMIGIGYDGNSNNFISSVIRVSLYDTSEEKMTLLSYITISEVAMAEILISEKALAVDKGSLIFGFSAYRDLGSSFTQGYYVFNVLNDKLNDLVYVSNFEEDMTDGQASYDNFRKYINRAFVYDGYAYFVADSHITSYGLDSLLQGDKVPACSISTIIANA